ncbi:MAG: agmatine deiminase family protein [Pirellulaceae bacterium]
MFDVYHQLLPGWKVVGIDAEELIQLAGALHCVSMNVAAIETLPLFPVPQRQPPLPLPLTETSPLANNRFLSIRQTRTKPGRFYGIPFRRMSIPPRSVPIMRPFDRPTQPLPDNE